MRMLRLLKVPSGDEAAALAMVRVRHCWAALRTALGAGEEAALVAGCALLRGMDGGVRLPAGHPPTCAGRAAWEAAFQAPVAGPAAAAPQALLAAEVTAAGRAPDDALTVELCELRSPELVASAPYRAACLPNLLCAAATPRVEAVERVVATAGGSSTAQLPRLLDALAVDSPLRLLVHLPVFGRWAALAQATLGHAVSRREAAELAIAGALARLPPGSVLHRAAPALLSAWNACRHLADGHGCSAFPGGIPELTMASSFASACVGPTDAGLCLRAMVDALVGMHNAWLEHCSGGGGETRNAAVVPTVPVARSTAGDMLQAEAALLLSGRTRPMGRGGRWRWTCPAWRRGWRSGCFLIAALPAPVCRSFASGRRSSARGRRCCMTRGAECRSGRWSPPRRSLYCALGPAASLARSRRAG